MRAVGRSIPLERGRRSPGRIEADDLVSRHDPDPPPVIVLHTPDPRADVLEPIGIPALHAPTGGLRVKAGQASIGGDPDSSLGIFVDLEYLVEFDGAQLGRRQKLSRGCHVPGESASEETDPHAFGIIEERPAIG